MLSVEKQWVTAVLFCKSSTEEHVIIYEEQLRFPKSPIINAAYWKNLLLLVQT